MSQPTHPTFGNGKICYLEIPADDISVSAKFYQTVFGWNVRFDEEGNASFDDSVGEVSGMWVKGRKRGDGSGVMISIMVNDLAATVSLIAESGGTILQDAPGNSSRTQMFQDPAGNVFCLYRHGKG